MLHQTKVKAPIGVFVRRTVALAGLFWASMLACTRVGSKGCGVLGSWDLQVLRFRALGFGFRVEGLGLRILEVFGGFKVSKFWGLGLCTFRVEPAPVTPLLIVEIPRIPKYFGNMAFCC